MSIHHPFDGLALPRSDDVATRALAYLESHSCMSLATDGPAGLWAATVFYVNDAFDLFFLSRSNTRHVRNLDASPRVAATISDDVAHWLSVRGIQLEGTAELVDDSARGDVLAAFGRRYACADSLWWTDDPRDAGVQQRAYRIRPTRVLFVDHRFRDARCEVPAEILRRAAGRVP